MLPNEQESLHDCVSAVRQRYGPRLVDILLLGSRARGDARPDSDADVAVILQEGDWDFREQKWTARKALAGAERFVSEVELCIGRTEP
jgi:predicted nucleotidyltransferase